MGFFSEYKNATRVCAALTFISMVHDAGIILLLQLLYLALAVPQLPPLVDDHVSQLLQLGPDVRGGDVDLRLNLFVLDLSICPSDIVPRHPSTLTLSPRPV